MTIVERPYRLKVDGTLARLVRRRQPGCGSAAACGARYYGRPRRDARRRGACGRGRDRRGGAALDDVERATVTLAPIDDGFEIRTAVVGRRRLTDVHLLGGRSLMQNAPTGFLPSGWRFARRFRRTPRTPLRSCPPASRRRSASPETASRGAAAGSSLPRRSSSPSPARTTGTGSAFSLAAPVDELDFQQLEYRPLDAGFSFVLDYDGPRRSKASSRRRRSSSPLACPTRTPNPPAP